jgi:hypothetical protein
LLNITVATGLPCLSDVADVVSVRWDGLLTGVETGETYEFAVTTGGKIRFWIHAWKMVDLWTTSDKTAQHIGLWNFTARDDIQYPVRVEFQTQLGKSKKKNAFVQLLWRKAGANEDFVPIPSSAFSPLIAPAEARRESTQAGLAKGWNTWYRASAAAHVHLPTGFGFKLALVQQTQLQHDASSSDRSNENIDTDNHAVNASTFTTTTAATTTTSSSSTYSWDTVDKCIDESKCKVRPGRHALNGSITGAGKH